MEAEETSILAGLTERQEKLYADFYNSTKDNEHLSRREALLVGLAAAMAVNCIPCQRFCLLENRNAGVSKDDVCEVLAKVMALSAGQKRLQLQEVLDRFKIDLSLFPGPAGPWRASDRTRRSVNSKRGAMARPGRDGARSRA